MDWLSKLEKKFGKYAIHNLTIYLLGCYVIGYLVYNIRPELLNWLTLEPAYILKGQIWRIVSWILIPPSGNIITVLIMLMFYYSLGTMLDRTWGSFRYNVYIFSGILFTVLGAFILYFVMGGNLVGFGGYFSTYYINMSIFLAFATSYPEMKVLLYFVIPIKMKWMAAVYAVFMVYTMAIGNIVTKVSIIASLLNFIVFFLSSKSVSPYMPKQQIRKKKFEQQTKVVPPVRFAGGARHKCAVCGRTELDDPTLEFRYCSKCNGNYEYCQDHLFTHEHVR